MTFPEFDKYQADLLEQVLKMKNTKGREYATKDNRFANFEEDARDNDITRLQAAGIHLNKHMRAIKSYIGTGEVFSEPIQGRIVDAITYLTLIGGMIAEEELANRDPEAAYLAQQVGTPQGTRKRHCLHCGGVEWMDTIFPCMPPYVNHTWSEPKEY